MWQDNHQQQTFTRKSNVEFVTVESYMTSCVNFRGVDEPFTQVQLPDNVIDVQGNVQFAHKVT